jgi:Arm domain-containing DNA-binding protein
MGLGSYPTVTLADARADRDKWRKVLQEGLDPRVVRDKVDEPAAPTKTFGEVADEYILRHEPAFSKSYGFNWRNGLGVHAKELRHIPVDKITPNI